MGEAKKKKEAHIEGLLMTAITLDLYGLEEILDIPVAEIAWHYNGCGTEWLPSAAELARSYNGCGPEWLPSAVREKLTEYFAIFEPAFMIHDWRFSRSDGTRCGFNAANFELENNLRRIAKANYGFFNLRRYGALAAAEVIVEACSRYGWSAWCAGRMEDERKKVKGEGEESQTSTGHLHLKPSPKPLAFFAALTLLSGCYRSIELIREGEYSLTYTAVGLKTDVSKIKAEKMTNGTVRVLVEGVATDVSERNAKIIESSGTAVGNIAKEVVEGIK